MKNQLKSNVSAHVLQTTTEWKAVKTTLLPLYKSAYQLYLESQKRPLPTTNEPLSKEELDAIFKSLRFHTYPGQTKQDRQLIYDILTLVNQKSPTGRLILRQIPPHVLINTQRRLGFTAGETPSSRRHIDLNHQMLHADMLPQVADTLLHEMGHIIDYEQIRSLTPEPVGYYSPQGEKISFGVLNEVNPRHHFALLRLEEAEKRALDMQILSEISSFRDIRKMARRQIIRGFSFKKKKKQSQSIAETDEFIKTQTKETLGDILIIKLRYIYFKWRFKMGLDKISGSPQPSQAEIQEAAAKKNVSSTIKELLSHKRPLNKTSNILTGGAAAAAVATIIEPVLLPLVWGTFLGQFPIALHQGSILSWKETYNKSSFPFLSLIKKRPIKKSDEYFYAHLQAVSDKYNNHLTPQDISQTDLKELPQYQKTFDTWDKLNTIDPQVATELKIFAVIQTLNKEQIKRQETKSKLVFTEEHRIQLFTNAFILADKIYEEARQKTLKNPNTTIEEKIREEMLRQLKNNKAKAAIVNSDFNMLTTSTDTRLLHFLLKNDMPLPNSKTARKKLSKKIHQLKQETQAQLDEATKNNKKAAQKELLSKLNVLKICMVLFHQQNKNQPIEYEEPTVEAQVEQAEQEAQTSIQNRTPLTPEKIRNIIKKRISKKR